MNHDVPRNSTERKQSDIALEKLITVAKKYKIDVGGALKSFKELLDTEISTEQLEAEWLALSDEDLARETETATGERLEEVLKLYATMNFKMHVHRAVIEEKKRKNNI